MTARWKRTPRPSRKRERGAALQASLRMLLLLRSGRWRAADLADERGGGHPARVATRGARGVLPGAPRGARAGVRPRLAGTAESADGACPWDAGALRLRSADPEADAVRQVPSGREMTRNDENGPAEGAGAAAPGASGSSACGLWKFDATVKTHVW